MARAVVGRCPSCGVGSLFRRFLKPVERCRQCGFDWSYQQADDFPAYVSIFLTGHILAPLIIALVKDTELSTGALVSILLPFSLLLMIGLLQPAKGAIIAVQWWFGMHGFEACRTIRKHGPSERVGLGAATAAHKKGEG